MGLGSLVAHTKLEEIIRRKKKGGGVRAVFFANGLKAEWGKAHAFHTTIVFRVCDSLFI